VSVVEASSWTALATNSHAADARQSLYPYLKDLCFTRDGRLLVATLLDPLCSCRERKTLRGYRPVSASIYVFDGSLIRSFIPSFICLARATCMPLGL